MEGSRRCLLVVDLKPRTVLRILLLLPYLLWLAAILLVATGSSSEGISPLERMVQLTLGLVAIVAAIYVVSIEFWGVPYTLLALGLLIWSRNQSAKRIYQALYLSPIMLAPLILIELLIVYSYDLRKTSVSPALLNDWMELGWLSLMVSMMTLFFGYLAVALGMGAYKLLDFLGVIKVETQHAQDVPRL